MRKGKNTYIYLNYFSNAQYFEIKMIDKPYFMRFDMKMKLVWQIINQNCACESNQFIFLGELEENPLVFR